VVLRTSVVLTAWARRLPAVCSAAQHQRILWEGKVWEASLTPRSSCSLPTSCSVSLPHLGTIDRLRFEKNGEFCQLLFKIVIQRMVKAHQVTLAQKVRKSCFKTALFRNTLDIFHY